MPTRTTVCAVALLIALALLPGCATNTPREPTAPVAAPTASSAGDQVLASAFDSRRSGIEVTGGGTVTRILADDNEGDRHQRFIVRLASGQTILIAHNIDIAPRVGDLQVGDAVEFRGVYEWNEQGGTVHWTHHDPDGAHAPGWIKHKGAIYQ